MLCHEILCSSHQKWIRYAHSNMNAFYLYRGASGKKPTCQCRRHKRLGYRPWAETIPWRREYQHIAVFLPGKFHDQRRLTGYSPACSHGVAELDTTEHIAHITDIQYYNSFSCTTQWFNIILYLNLLQNKDYLLPLLYPFICWWTLRLLPCLSYCK